MTGVPNIAFDFRSTAPPCVEATLLAPSTIDAAIARAGAHYGIP
jgi:hypothetical protein